MGRRIGRKGSGAGRTPSRAASFARWFVCCSFVCQFTTRWKRFTLWDFEGGSDDDEDGDGDRRWMCSRSTRSVILNWIRDCHDVTGQRVAAFLCRVRAGNGVVSDNLWTHSTHTHSPYICVHRIWILGALLTCCLVTGEYCGTVGSKVARRMA